MPASTADRREAKDSPVMDDGPPVAIEWAFAHRQGGCVVADLQLPLPLRSEREEILEQWTALIHTIPTSYLAAWLPVVAERASMLHQDRRPKPRLTLLSSPD